MAKTKVKDKPKKPRIRQWRGLLAEAPRRVRIGAFGLLAIVAVSLVFTQLGIVGLGEPGKYLAYGNVLITAVALGGLLLGMPLGTLLGFIAGTATYIHALVQPLDNYEAMFITPISSILLFTFLGFFTGFLLALALRCNPPLVRRIIYIAIIGFVVSLVYTIFSSINMLIAVVFRAISLTMESGGSDAVDANGLAFTALSQIGDPNIQCLFDAGVMIVVCIIADILTRKATENEGHHSLLTIMRGWLIGIVVGVFAVTAGISFVLITEGAKTSASSNMAGDIDYLCNQLKNYDTRMDLIAKLLSTEDSSDGPLGEGDAEQIRRAFSIEGIMEGYDKETDGTVAIIEGDAVLASNDDNIKPGTPLEGVLAAIGVGRLDTLAESGVMHQIVYNPVESSLASGSISTDDIVEMREQPISTQMAFTRVGQVNDYYVMIIYPATKVFESRVAVMASTTLSVLVMLAVVFVFFTLMMSRIVLRRIDETNGVLAKITDGDLKAKVDIRDSREFASLSDGINTTVDTLRGWIAEAESRMEAELTTAKAIQESALPRIFPPFPDIVWFDIYASMQAAREVGGDFYDFFLIGEDSNPESGKLGFVLADVSGKGVPAALFMMTAKTLLRDYMRSGIDLGEAVENANRQLCDGNEKGMFVTAFVGVLEYPSGHVTYVNAGHNPPLLWHQGEYRWMTERSGMPLGLFDGFPYETFAIDCSIGDQFFIYTDGVTEAMDVDGQLYGEERLEAFVSEHVDMHPRKLVAAVRHDVMEHARGAEQSDDITMLSLEIGVPPESTATLIVPATTDELPHVIEFIHTELDRRLCPLKVQKQLDVAVEELFVNVAHYSYPDATPENPGTARIGYTYSAEPPSMTVTIADDGVPYNPLAKPDAVTPDDIMEVPIGGLGILMAKRSVDEMTYEYLDGSNVVTLVKRW